MSNKGPDKSIIDPVQFGACIKVVGVGGSGGNAIDHMINSGVSGVDFVAVNCDVQDLHHSKAGNKIHIGKNLTKGLGAGMNPEIGKRAAEETKNEIQDALKGANLIFITCGLGGGTGTGASPIVAEVARQQGILTIAVVTKPFSFEGAERARIAEDGLKQLIEAVDTVIVIPNDRLLEISDQKTTLKSAFAMCDNVLKNAVQGISELIIKPGIINLDFADVRTIVAEAGPAMMGIGQATGNQRAVEAARKAISSPLLDISIEGAKGILFAVTGGEDMTLLEVNEAAKIITASVDPDAKIIFGAIHDENIPKGAIKITVIAAGFENKGSNIITKERMDFSADADAELESNFNKDKDDKHIPAFLRRGKSPPVDPVRSKISKMSAGLLEANRTSNGVDKSEPLRIKRDDGINRTLVHVPGDIRPKPSRKEFLKNYHDKFQPSRNNNLRDFYKEGNFWPRALKVFKATFSILKRITEVFIIEKLKKSK